MMKLFEAKDWEKLGAHVPREKELVSAQFSHDLNWYRAQVKKINDGGSSYDVLFIDFGNSETVPAAKIRQLLMFPEFLEKPGLVRQAKMGKLAYIVPPKPTDEFGQDAIDLFKKLVWGKNLSATCYTDYKTKAETLVVGDPELELTINHALVSAGLARTEKRKYGNNKYFQGLKEEEDKAKRDRLNIWQYGDIPDSDDEKFH